MKIEDNRSNVRTFEKLAVGSVFEVNQEVYMKATSSYEVEVNSINLITGFMHKIDDNYEVHLIDDVTLVLN